MNNISKIQIISVDKDTRNKKLIAELLTVWQESVQATHLFLTKSNIEEIFPQVEIGLKFVPHLLVAFDDKMPIGFAGIAEDKLEMLFISPKYFKQGVGYKLFSLAIKNYDVQYVDVNEQNPNALNFYIRQGFKIFNHTPLDDMGRPFPILQLKK